MSVRKDSEVEPCALCGGMQLKRVIEEKGFWIWRCRSCGLVQVRPLPAQIALANESYWNLDLDDPITRAARRGSRHVFEHGLRRLSELTGSSIRNKRLLDIGCGLGTVLELAQAAGAQAVGVDVSEQAAAWVRAQLDCEVTVGEFESLRFEEGAFDVVTGWNVLEHTRRPDLWLKKVHHVLTDGGVLLVKVPNVWFSSLATQLNPLFRRASWPTASYLATHPPLHLYGFSPVTLRRILAGAGFDVLAVEAARVREGWGWKGRLVRTLSSGTSFLMGGRVSLQPVMFAVARKRAG